jgi:site-specific DNA-methyltransferase (adenine-specific)
LEEPTRAMITEAKAVGQFYHAQMGRNYDKIQIVTVQEMIEQHKRLEIPMSFEVLKAAQRDLPESQIDIYEILEQAAKTEIVTGDIKADEVN